MERDTFYRQLRADSARRYKEFDAASMETLFDLVQTFMVIESRIAGLIQPHGLTLSGLNVLAILRQHPGGIPLNRLSHLLLVSRANITGVIDSVVRKGLVETSAHATDRRVRLARITRKGEAFLDRYYPAHYVEISKLFKVLNRTEKNQMIKLLAKLRQHVQALPALRGES